MAGLLCLRISFFSGGVRGVSHLDSVVDDVGVEVYDDALVDEFISDSDNGVEVVVDGFSEKGFFFNHGEGLSDAVNDSLHDKVIFLLIANEVDLEFIDDLEKD